MTEPRQEILMGVWHLIATEGIEAVTFRKVASAAGVSPGRVQHYFASRRELVHASVRAMVEASTEQHVAGHSATTSLAALRDVVVHAIPTAPEARVGLAVWYAYLARCAADPVVADIITEAKQGQEAEAARLLAALGVGDATQHAREMIALADGLATRVQTGDLTAVDAVATVEHHLEVAVGAARSLSATAGAS